MPQEFPEPGLYKTSSRSRHQERGKPGMRYRFVEGKFVKANRLRVVLPRVASVNPRPGCGAALLQPDNILD
jgi:hypothetical protein